jgi:hypothetical protein
MPVAAVSTKRRLDAVSQHVVLLFSLLGDQRLDRARERGIVALAGSPDEAKDEISTRHNNRMTTWAARCARQAGSAAKTAMSTAAVHLLRAVGLARGRVGCVLALVILCASSSYSQP